MIDIKEISLDHPQDKELTFNQAVERANDELENVEGRIIELRLHPSGIWTVQWILE